MIIKRYRVDCGNEAIFRWTYKGARHAFASLVTYVSGVRPYFRGLRFSLVDCWTGETLKRFEG